MRRLRAIAASRLVAHAPPRAGDRLRRWPASDYCGAVEEHQAELTDVTASGSPAALLEALPIFRDLAEQAPDDIRDEWKRCSWTALTELRRRARRRRTSTPRRTTRRPPRGPDRRGARAHRGRGRPRWPTPRCVAAFDGVAAAGEGRLPHTLSVSSLRPRRWPPACRRTLTRLARSSVHPETLIDEGNPWPFPP